MKKTKKSTKKTTCAKCDSKCILCHPSTWIAMVLLLALLVIYGVSMYGFKALEQRTKFETAKLAIADDLLKDYIEQYEVVDSGSHRQMTGYGISDEDNVFYLTFDYVRFDDNDKTVRHGIMYFWPDENGGYSRAFSYHDDDYHPGGDYLRISEGINGDLIKQAPDSHLNPENN